MVRHSVVASHQPGAVTVKNISASEQGLGSPQPNFPFQRMDAVPVPVPEKHAHTSGMYFGVEKGTSTDEVGNEAAFESDTPVATAGNN